MAANAGLPFSYVPTRSSVSSAASLRWASAAIGSARSRSCGMRIRSRERSNFRRTSSAEKRPDPHEPEKQLHVGLEKAQAVGGLDEIGLRPAPDLVRADQPFDLRNQIVIGLLAAEPGADDARAPLRVRPLVLRVDQRLVDRLVRPRERPLHVVCQRRQTDGLGRARARSDRATRAICKRWCRLYGYCWITHSRAFSTRRELVMRRSGRGAATGSLVERSGSSDRLW